MKRNVVLSLLVIAAATLGGSFAISQAGPASESAASSETKTDLAMFSIENMTCATCPISVRKAMQRVDGVISVEVDFESKSATVVFDPGQTTPEEIAAASSNVGYPAAPKA